MDTGEDANCGSDLPLSEAVVIGGMDDRAHAEYAACWGSFGQPVLVAVH